MHRVKAVVYWKGMTKDIKHLILQLVICQRNKYEISSSRGLLQHITMDFIEGLLNYWEKHVIFVVVDRLSKATNFMALSHSYTVKDVAQSSMDHVFKLHGFPNTITSDHDEVFVSNF